MMVNPIHKRGCEDDRFGTTSRIKTLITASKAEHFRYSVGMMELEKKRADHVVQART
jgi:hypothetical protein